MTLISPQKKIFSIKYYIAGRLFVGLLLFYIYLRPENIMIGKMLREIVIIFGCLILGNIVKYLLGISVPGSVFGMIILFLLLNAGYVKENQIKKVSGFLLDNMAFFFVPVGVGVVLYMDIIKSELFSIMASSLISTLIILLIVGLISGGKWKK